MQIAIDGNEANSAQRVGSNLYALQILSSLYCILEKRSDMHVTVLLSAPPLHDLPPTRDRWQYAIIGPRFFWTQYALPWHLFSNKRKYDVFYTPGHYAPRVSAVPYISSVMDLAFLYFPEQFKKKDYLQLREWTRYSVKHAAKVITISEYSKRDIIKTYHLHPDKVVVAYPSTVIENERVEANKAQQPSLKKWKIKQPYLLYVGTLQPRKNLLRLIEAFERLQEVSTEMKVKQLQLVLAGKVGWLADDILKKIDHSPLREKIILTGYVSESEKALLYKESLCSVLVGLYEGFGMPALEALAYGSLPVVAGNTSLPEVVGKKGIFVDPYNVNDIARGLLDAITLSAKERARRLRAGRMQLKLFSWNASAQRILDEIIVLGQKSRK